MAKPQTKGASMGIINIMQRIKQIHSKDIVVVKIGKFYQCYGKDAIILAYLFGYKLQTKDNIPFCGFPMQTENKVRANLEQKKTNYIIVNRRNNYEVEDSINFKNLNTYEEIYKKAKEYISVKERIEKIYNTLIKSIGEKDNAKIIKEIEEILNERGKI